MTKGIVLAGGLGTRLFPSTLAINKHLLTIYDKPMIYYPLSVLMLAGIKEILIISTSEDLYNFKKLFKDGRDLGISIKYKAQPKPEGIAQAFILGEEFIGNDNVTLILGDNIFYGQGLIHLLKKTIKKSNKSSVYVTRVSDPKSFAVVQFDKSNKVIGIEEKPSKPNSNFVVTGLYFYTNEVIKIAKKIKPSDRNELEITSVNLEYLNKGLLDVVILGRGYSWLDTGTHEGLNNASNFVQTIEKRQGIKIACLEEISFNNGWITKKQIKKVAESFKKSDYGRYLYSLI